MSVSPRRTWAMIDGLDARKIEIAERPADYGRAGGEHAQVIEIAPILGDAAGRRLAEPLGSRAERLLARARGQHHVALRDHHVRGCRLVVVRPAQRDDLHARGQPAHHLAERLAEEIRVADRDLEQLEAGDRGGLELRFEDHERDVQEQDRAGDTERVGNRVAHRGVVVAERRDGRLQRRRARARASEQPERVADVQPHRLHEHDAHRARQQHADQRHHVRPAAGGARQAEEELLAVLDARPYRGRARGRASRPSAPAPTSARTSP